MNILIIDDDADDTALFCEAVKELFPEANCTTVGSCDQIEKTIITTHPDIIFVDGHIHPKSGADCLNLINNVVDRTQTKIVIHSGSLSPSELNDLSRGGADDIVLKAISYKDLKANIERIIIDKFNLASRL